MAPNRAKLEMLGQRIGATQGCDPSADSSADKVGQSRLSHHSPTTPTTQPLILSARKR
jgi:hypothetical protein